MKGKLVDLRRECVCVCEMLHATILLVGEQSARAGHTLADVGEGAQVGLLGLVAVLAQQRVHDLLLQVGSQLTALDVAVDDGLCGGRFAQEIRSAKKNQKNDNKKKG